MNKKVLIGAGAAIVIIAIALIAFNGRNNTQTTDNGADDSSILSEGTLRDLMNGNLGENVKCSLDYPVGQNSTLSGQTYIAGNKLRVDYKMIPPINGQEDLHMISDGEYNYIWGNSTIGNMFSGMKFKVIEDSETGEVDNSDMGDYVDYDMPMLDCEKWTVDDSLFEAPGDIEFTDMSAMMGGSESGELEEGAESSVGVPMMDCSVCDQMPVDQQDMCLSSLNCN